MIRLSVPEILQPGFFVTDGRTEELGILVVGLKHGHHTEIDGKPVFVKASGSNLHQDPDLMGAWNLLLIGDFMLFYK